MCCGGNSGQRPLEQEERDLLAMQARVAEQGMRGREEAMGGFRDFARRGQEMGSLANQEREGNRAMTDAYTAYGNANQMRDADMASMGINPGDARFQRGRDTAGVQMAAGAAGAANTARSNTRREALGLESAGYAGLAGFDPSGALNSMGSVIGNAQRTGMMADAASAQGWGNLAQAGMYGLQHGSDIVKGGKAIGDWMSSFNSPSVPLADGGEVPSYAEGGEVMGMQRYASGGNVYDQAMGSVNQAGAGISTRRPAPNPQPAVDPYTATSLAKSAVDKVASSMGVGAKAGATPQSLQYANAVGANGGDSLGAMINANQGWAGVNATGADAAATAGADAAATAGADAAATAAGTEAAGGALAGTLGTAGAALGAALPWVGGAMLLGSALGLKDGGMAKPGIGRKAVQGRAQNPKGGKVSGPGGPKDDMVMARLSPGEFVMPVGAVKKFGLDRMEKMRQAGLDFEKQRNIQ